MPACLCKIDNDISFYDFVNKIYVANFCLQKFSYKYMTI